MKSEGFSQISYEVSVASLSTKDDEKFCKQSCQTRNMLKDMINTFSTQIFYFFGTKQASNDVLGAKYYWCCSGFQIHLALFTVGDILKE